MAVGGAELAGGYRQDVGEGPLLLADISGYTSFLQAVAAAHADDAFAGGNIPEAYRMMSSLLDGIVGSLVPPYELAKLEGDAVFVFGRTTDAPRGEAVIDGIRACYAAFQASLAQVGEVWACTCDACLRANALDLKFIIHAGRYVEVTMAGRRELSGPDVVLAHRLLKNHATEVVPSGAYALLTTGAVSRLEIPVDGAPRTTETYEHYAPMEAFVLAL